MATTNMLSALGRPGDLIAEGIARFTLRTAVAGYLFSEAPDARQETYARQLAALMEASCADNGTWNPFAYLVRRGFEGPYFKQVYERAMLRLDAQDDYRKRSNAMQIFLAAQRTGLGKDINWRGVISSAVGMVDQIGLPVKSIPAETDGKNFLLELAKTGHYEEVAEEVANRASYLSDCPGQELVAARLKSFLVSVEMINEPSRELETAKLKAILPGLFASGEVTLNPDSESAYRRAQERIAASFRRREAFSL